MNKGTKVGAKCGVLFFTAFLFVVQAVKLWNVPTESFAVAKNKVARTYNVTSDEVALYRYESESWVWDSIFDSNMLSEDHGIYPIYAYTARVNDDEKILSISFASKEDPSHIRGNVICGKNLESYKYTWQYVDDGWFIPVYYINVYINDELDVPRIQNAIEEEINK